MMAYILGEGFRKSNKFHRCDGNYWIEQAIGYIGCELKHFCNNILKGKKYWWQTYCDTEILTFKCCLPCKEFAEKNNIKFNDEQG